MLCYVTPKEHLGLPNKEDVKRGANRIQNRRPRRPVWQRPSGRADPDNRGIESALRIPLGRSV